MNRVLKVGETLQGRKLIATETCDDTQIVLMEVCDRYTPFVTWHRNTETGEVYWGHYFSDEKDAWTDYRARVAKCRRKAYGIV